MKNKTVYPEQDLCKHDSKHVACEIIQTMLAVLEALDPYTLTHSRNVANYAQLLAKELNLPADQIKTIHYGGLFHDLGKIGISPDLLKKQGPLTTDEYERIKQHPATGAHILSHIAAFHDFVPIVLHHHENFDGSGYPKGLIGLEIPLGARIVSIVDAYDALTSNRAYRNAQTGDYALDEIIKNASIQFDPEIVRVFVGIAERF